MNLSALLMSMPWDRRLKVLVETQKKQPPENDSVLASTSPPIRVPDLPPETVNGKP